MRIAKQPMGFWPPTVLVRDACRHGVTVHPLDINVSSTRCILDGEAVHIGFNYLQGFGAGAERIVDARADESFCNLGDLYHSTQLPRHLVKALLLAGACDGWGQDRRRLVWELGTLRYTKAELDLPVSLDADVPPLDAGDAAALQAALLQVSTAEHSLARWRTQLTARGYTSSADLPGYQHGQRVQVVGTVIMHQAPPTAKGFHFLTLEDELGMINVVVRPWLVAQLPPRTNGRLHVTGVVQHEGGVVNLLTVRIAPGGSL